ncbi:MAG: 23S rRNA (uridine(2552)-2'-O)-methyltransferase RlmE [Gammaproteobacteria bacterium]|nr:23S rRNA (uridine(2552)-2'-O)-methyltransferase RlmE [Gammaproteobacteria bacterium]
MAQSGSQKRWLKEHEDDFYVKQAKLQGYRCRASFKLLELQEKDRLIHSGMTIVDLGSAPGGWSQVAVDWIGSKGHIIALDILPMDPIAGVTFIQGDFSSDEVYEKLCQTVGEQQIDVVLSDLSPNLSGNKTTDQARALHLVELALDFASSHLKPGGSFVTKVFHGSGFEEFVKTMRSHFKTVSIRKPDSSRSRSSECYIVGKGFKG